MRITRTFIIISSCIMLHTASADSPLHLAGMGYSANVHTTNNENAFVWDGGRSGVPLGEAVFIEGRTPIGLMSLDLNTSMVDDNLILSWSFHDASGSAPVFPLAMQSATLTLWDIRWRDSSDNIVETGVISAKMLNSNWQPAYFGNFTGFAYAGPATITSLDDLAFSARLLNSATVPEPSSCILTGLGVAAVALTRLRVQTTAR